MKVLDVNVLLNARDQAARRHATARRWLGEDVDLDAFRAAYGTDEPVRLNQGKAVERGVDQLYN